MQQFFRIDNWKFWSLLALAVKSLIFVHYITNFHSMPLPGFWGGAGGDTESYLAPINNFLSTGHYAPDDRMPGYGLVYMPLRFFLGYTRALNALILIQLIVSTISVYVFAITIYKIINRTGAFYYSFFMYLLSFHIFQWDYLLYTESFSISFFVFFAFFLRRYFDHLGNYLDLLWAGFFLTWIIFLRPVCAITIPLITGVLIIQWLRGGEVKKISVAILWFLLPFVVVDSAWLARNYTVHKVVRPLTLTVTTPYYTGTYRGSLFTFIKAWGGSFLEWIPGEEDRWFYPKKWKISGFAGKQDHEIIMPSYIYTSKFNIDSLIQIRKTINLYDSLADKNDTIALPSLEKNINTRLDAYTLSIKTEKPFLYYVRSRFSLLFKFLTRKTGIYKLFDYPHNKAQILIITLLDIMYYFAAITGLSGAFLILFSNIKNQKNDQYTLLSFSLVFLCNLFVLPFVLRFSEQRYLAQIYPLMLTCSAYLIFQIKWPFAGVIHSLFQRKNTND